jgi:GNAT superfamily N-acetyltransferase
MQIRPAKPADAMKLATVHVQSWRETYSGIIPNHVLDALSVENRAMMWLEITTNRTEKNFVYVAEDASEGIVGFVSGGAQRDKVLTYRGEVFALYLLQAHQKLGIGRQLFQTMMERLRVEGYDSVLVWVLVQNPVRHFYEKMGGVYATEKEIEIGGATLLEVAYGWRFNEGDSTERLGD